MLQITFNWDFYGPGHYWSLAVEEHFYLFWPFIVFIFNKQTLKRIAVAIILIALLLRVAMLMQSTEVFYFTFTRFDALAFGAYLAISENDITIKSRTLFLKILTVSLLAVGVLYFGFSANPVIVQTLKYLFYAFIYFAFIGYVICDSHTSLLSKFLNTSFLQYTGKVSYGLYVYHPLIILFMAKYIKLDSLILNFSILIAITYAVSSLSFKYFESFFLRFKSRIPGIKKSE